MEVDHPLRPQQLVYEPQSIATPVKAVPSTEAAIAEDIVDAKSNAADATSSSSASSAVESRRRKRRSFFGGTKQSPVPAKSAKRKSIANNHNTNTNSAGLLPGERRACLTEILWEDVQKAKELLGFRQKAAAADATPIPVECPQVPTPPSMQQHPVIARMMSHPPHPPPASSGMPLLHHHLHQQHHHQHPGHQHYRFAPIAILEEVENQPRSTASLPGRRSHRHRRASSDLAASSTPAAATVEAAASAALTLSPPDSLIVTAPSGVASLQHQQQQAVEHQRRVARFWELKRLLVELTERKAEKLRVLAGLEAKEKTLSGEFGCSTIGKSAADTFLSHHGGSHHSLDANCSQLSQQQAQHHQLSAVGENQLCFPTQYLVAFEHSGAQSELLQLQEEAAVQRALVEANARLVRECQTDKATRQFKRKRAQEYQRSQEKLRVLNQRIAEIRTKDTAANFASYCTQTASSSNFSTGDVKTSECAYWKQTSATNTSATGEGGGKSGSASAPWSQSLSLPALRRQQGQQQLLMEHPMRMQLSFRQHAHQLHGVATANTFSHAGSIDSGFQDLQSETVLSSSTSCFGVSSASSASSLVNGNSGRLGRQISDQSLHFRPIDDDQEGEGGAAAEGNQDEDMSGVY